MTFDRLGGDLRQVLCHGGGDGGECAEGGEAVSAAIFARSADAVVLVAEVPVAEADVDLVVGVSTSVLYKHKTMKGLPLQRWYLNETDLHGVVFHAAADHDSVGLGHIPGVLPRGQHGFHQLAGSRPLGVQAVLHPELFPLPSSAPVLN